MFPTCATEGCYLRGVTSEKLVWCSSSEMAEKRYKLVRIHGKFFRMGLFVCDLSNCRLFSTVVKENKGFVLSGKLRGE